VDFNDDGILDIIVGDRGGYVNYFRGTGTTQLTTEDRITANGVEIVCDSNSAPVIVDWNEDGLLDMLLGQEVHSTGSIRLYLNSGTPEEHQFTTYTWLQSGGTNIKWYRSCPQVADMNGDGKKDLIIGGDNGKIMYYENVGTNASPSFNGYEYLESDGSDIDLYIGTRLWINDWNEDGILDILVSDFDGWVYLYLGYETGIADDVSQSLSSRLDISVLDNPSIGSFSVQLTLPIAGDPTVAIYSLDGRIIETRALSGLGTGMHNLVFDISGQAAGTYFVQVEQNGLTATDKLALLR